MLLVEDDEENLRLLLDLLPKEIGGFSIRWDPCNNFEEAIERVEAVRYDLIVTDVYKDRAGRNKGSIREDERAPGIVNMIRARRFCPIVIFSDGSVPQGVELGPFVRFADKSGGDADIVARIEEILSTGIPKIAKLLHDELDRSAGSYLWEFLESHWEELESARLAQGDTLERLIRRRAGIQIGRLGGDAQEVDSIEGGEFYIYPPISGSSLRMGEVIRNGEEFRVILTPHCHLTTQPGDDQPRADFVLTVKTVDARSLFERTPLKKGKEKDGDMRKRLQSPAILGRPSGRYWFLPGFLGMADRYCDFLQVESISLADLPNVYQRFAVLDAPFAEALQSCFAAFYSAVGIPRLRAERFDHLG